MPYRTKNAVEVKTHLMLRARFKRKYKDINIHDKARIFKNNQKYSEMKEHVKHWSDKTYEVIEKLTEAGYIDKLVMNYRGIGKTVPKK